MVSGTENRQAYRKTDRQTERQRERVKRQRQHTETKRSLLNTEFLQLGAAEQDRQDCSAIFSKGSVTKWQKIITAAFRIQLSEFALRYNKWYKYL